MAFEQEYLDLMPNTITVALVASRDKYGELTFGDPISYRCRITEEQTQVSTWVGVQQIAGTTIWCAPHPTSGIPNIGPEDQITLPDGTHPTVLRVQVVQDEEGDHHFKIYCDRPYRA